MILAKGHWGTDLYLEGKHPRKELLDKLGRSHADKVYIDTKSGVKHIGYIVAGQWFTFYNLTQWEGKESK
jgi:hypothetical protein